MANLILLFLLSITQVLGDIWLSKAMKQFGEVNLVNFESWIATFKVNLQLSKLTLNFES